MSERDTAPFFAAIEAEQRDRAARIISKNLLRKIRVALKVSEQGGIHKVHAAVSSKDPEIAQFNLWAQQERVLELLREALPGLNISIKYEFCWHGTTARFMCCNRWPPRHRLVVSVSPP